ncbi:hypothetical protein Hanom_Chr12g01107711 [Helianthus anomalus]
MKFFFVREEVMPITMIFWESDKIEKEELPIPKTVDWYMHSLATPNRIFGEQVLVSAAMSDKWPERSEVPVLMFNGEAFANPPTATEGAQLPKPRPLRGVTSAGKEILYLSSEKSIGSSQEELSSWSNIFAGVLRYLGIDPKEKPKRAPAKKKMTLKKKVTVDTGAMSKKAGASRAVPEKGTLRFRQSNLEDYVVASDSLEGLSHTGEKKSGAAASKSSGSAGSRALESGSTPSSLHEEEEEEEEVEEEEGARLVTRKRSREETNAGDTPPA